MRKNNRFDQIVTFLWNNWRNHTLHVTLRVGLRHCFAAGITGKQGSVSLFLAQALSTDISYFSYHALNRLCMGRVWRQNKFSFSKEVERQRRERRCDNRFCYCDRVPVNQVKVRGGFKVERVNCSKSVRGNEAKRPYFFATEKGRYL